ncbi:MAG: tetratricopeptide repeat protein [Actinomycetota bacterium]
MPKPPRKAQPGRPRPQPAGRPRPAGPGGGKATGSKKPFNRPPGAGNKPRGSSEVKPAKPPADGAKPQPRAPRPEAPKGRPPARKAVRPGPPKAGSATERGRARPAGRPGEGSGPGRPPGFKAKPGGKPGPRSAGAGDKKRSGYRPRPIHNKRPEGNGARLTADQVRDLPRQWVREIEQTARESMGPAVAAAVAAALEAFAGGDFEAAAKLAAQAKADAPRSAMIQEVLGLSLYHLGRWKQALTELMSYRRISGLLDQNHVIADCYRALDRPEKASEICAEVTKTDVAEEVWAETMIVAAGALADRSDLGRALRTLARAELNPAAVEPFHLRLWYVRADLLERIGRADEAAQMWERIVAEDPDFFDAEERMQASR